MRPFKAAKRSVRAERLEARRLLAVHIWTGANGSNWSDAQNWTGGAPSVGESSIVLDFPLGPHLTTVNDISGLSVDVVALDGPYDVSGNGIALNQGIAIADFPVGWSIDLSISSDVSFDVNGSGDSWLGAAITGAGGVTKTGNGSLILAGTNNYTGVTTVSAGDLKVGSPNALGSALANTVVTDGGALVDGMGVTCAEPVVISGNGDGVVPGALRADQASF